MRCSCTTNRRNVIEVRSRDTSAGPQSVCLSRRKLFIYLFLYLFIMTSHNTEADFENGETWGTDIRTYWHSPYGQLSPARTITRMNYRLLPLKRMRSRAIERIDS